MRSGLAILIALALPATAAANIFDIFALEPRGTGLAGALTASSDDHTAAWTNPALLVRQRKAVLGIGLSLASPSMEVKARDSAQASLLQLPASPPDFGGLTFGFNFPLGGKVQNRLAVGAVLYLPSNVLIRTEAIDPNQPQWYFYQSNPDRIVAAVGAGVRITDWAAVGAGFQILGALVGGFDYKVDLFTKEFKHRSLKNDIVTRVAPTIGLNLDVEAIGLRLGATWHGALQLDYSLPADFDLGELGTLQIMTEGTAHFSPHIFTFGAQWVRGPVMVTAEGKFSRWSVAPDPTVHVVLDVNGDILTSLGIENQFDADSRVESPGFSDTLSFAAGVEYHVTERFAARLGYSFRPTPAPLQTGDTNILDGDTHVIAAGLGVAFSDPLEVFSEPIHVDLGYERFIIPERVAEKGRNSPVPPYTYSGRVNHLAIGIRYMF